MSERREDKRKYKLIKKTLFSELDANHELPTSDLCFQDDHALYQFHLTSAEHNKIEIEPGVYSLIRKNGIDVSPVELQNRKLLEKITSTSEILKEARTFFTKLHVYEQLGLMKKRGVLLYSQPGLGKTTAIEKFCKESVTDDPGTVVIIWPTSQIDPDEVSNFLNDSSQFTEQCTRLILVIEDIGGGERESSGPAPVESGLLNLLDGIGTTFKLPTFIVATTNHAENLLSSLADRPGRFDLILQLKPPSPQERIELLKFIAKREITQAEEDAIIGKGTEKFSIAHIKEVVVRAVLHEKSIATVVSELVNHSKKFKKGFVERDDVGF